MKLYNYPLSSYGLKTIMALHEKAVEFETEFVNLTDEQGRLEYRKLYPIGKVPLLVLDDGHIIPESTIIIEYADAHFDTGTRLIPEDKDAARRVRFKDRMIDLYLNDSITNLTFQQRKAKADQDPALIERSEYRARIMYEFMDTALDKTEWLAGDFFSMADCSAAPALFYAQHVYPYSDYANIVSYFERLTDRDSWEKAIAHARPLLEEPAAANA